MFSNFPVHALCIVPVDCLLLSAGVSRCLSRGMCKYILLDTNQLSLRSWGTFSCCQDVVYGWITAGSSPAIALSWRELPHCWGQPACRGCSIHEHRGPGPVTQSRSWQLQNSLKGWLRTVQLLLYPNLFSSLLTAIVPESTAHHAHTHKIHTTTCQYLPNARCVRNLLLSSQPV